jgi:ATP-dependent RNA helicase DeaD
MSIADLVPALAHALQERGYTDLTPVQLAVIEPHVVGRDLLVSAKTGSGKTVAYGLALASDLLNADQSLGPAGAPLALVIAPTRELALQVQRELEWLYARVGARVISCVGGMDPRREQRALAAGAHIVVGTPGRLRDHLERGQLQMADLRVAVLDEADEMLDLGFREELEALLNAAPTERRTLLFSATLPKPIVALARAYQKDALRITASSGEEAHGDIDYRAVPIAPSDAEHAIVNLQRYYEAGAALVFCATREAVRRLHANLVERGFSVVALSGELSQTERSHALQALRDRRARVCVATDVAARGIDIPDLELVIHAELPNDAQSLQHRSGRTGRAGRKGVCVILVPHPRRRRAEAMLRTAHIEATWMPAPTAEDIRARDQERLIEQLRPSDDAADEDIVIAKALLADADAEHVVASLVRARRAGLPAAEDLVDNEPEPAPRPAARSGFEDSAWFTIDIGRGKNAEPRWLLPLICRRGNLTKRDIGAIRVFDRETRFEIAREAADRFVAALDKLAPDDVHIQPLSEPDMPAARDRARPRKAAQPPAVKAEGRPAKPSFGKAGFGQAEFGKSGPPQTSKRQTEKLKGGKPTKRKPNGGPRF